ncbi:hypothetical protein JW859_14140 [bacterium]|nr:hypothetical protein [bacterium]
MNDPLAGAGPYAGEYEDWDLWCYQYAVDSSDEEANARVKNWEDQGWFMLTTGVDADGNLVPYGHYLKEECESSIGNYTSEEDGGCAVSITGIGPMEADLRRELLAIACETRAAYVLPVPDWLAAAPPLSCRHLPDGNIAVQGELGSGSDLPVSTLMLWQEPDEPEAAWHLYSPEGELLGSTESGGAWWMLTFPDYEGKLEFEPGPDTFYYCWNGEIHAYDENAGGYMASFMYDGTEWDAIEAKPVTERRPVDPRTFTILSGAELPLIHAAQRKTPPKAPERYAEILQNWESLDLDQPVATGYDITGYAFRQVQPLDDPGNPYAADYGEWDRVCFAHHAKLCAEYDWNRLSMEDQQRVANEYELKVLEDLGDRKVPGYYVYPTTAYIDDNGYLVPYVLAQEIMLALQGLPVSPQAQAAQGIFDYEYRLQMNVPLEPDLQRARQQAETEMRALFYEPVPAWLADSPSLSAMFLPDGRIVTRGELGSLLGNGVSDVWCCYEPSGELVCQSKAGEEYWFAMLFKDFYAVLGRYGPRDQVFATDWRGIVHIGLAGPDAEADRFTYTGEPTELFDLAPNRPLLFEQIPGDDLAMIHRAQQEAAAAQ